MSMRRRNSKGVIIMDVKKSHAFSAMKAPAHKSPKKIAKASKTSKAATKKKVIKKTM